MPPLYTREPFGRSNNMEKLKIPYPVLVEGKYDKIKLDSIIEGFVITSEGFGIFKDDEKRTLLKKLSEKSPIIVLSDSDSAGMLIRKAVKNTLPKDRIINLYIPQIEGKERRKAVPSKEGFVGVEGVDAEILKNLLAPYSAEESPKKGRALTKTDMYAYGLSGADNSAERRQKVCRALSLPRTLTANQLIEAVNLLMDFEEFDKFLTNNDFNVE